MALLKNVVNADGIVSNYHKIGSVMMKDNVLHCSVDSYASKEYRINGSSAIDFNSYRFTLTTEEEESMGIRKLCYQKLKELPEWQDAEDC